MPAIVTNKFRIHNSEQFSESFSESGANVYYMLLGRPQAFATSTRGDSRTDNEGSDSANTSRRNETIFTFDDAIAAANQFRYFFVTSRRNWTTGTVYDYYKFIG